MPLPRDVFQLSDEQFNKIVELLTPGFECAKLMLADHQDRAGERARYEAEAAKEPAAPEDPAGSDSGDETA